MSLNKETKPSQAKQTFLLVVVVGGLISLAMVMSEYSKPADSGYSCEIHWGKYSM